MYIIVSFTLFVDVDECKENTHNCSQMCRDTTPGFECACDPGYEMNDDSTCKGKNLKLLLIAECSMMSLLGKSRSTKSKN